MTIAFIKFHVLQIKTEADPLSNDPAQYATVKLTPQQISVLLRAGPFQPAADYQFPRCHGRCFIYEWFHKTQYVRRETGCHTAPLSTKHSACLVWYLVGR